MNRREQIMEMMANDPDLVAEMLMNWETELSKTMPPDFKDWWQNSHSEWPLVARLVIESIREKERLAWDMLANAEEMKDGERKTKAKTTDTL